MVVFANSKTEWSSLPPGAAGLRSKAGSTIPMVLVTSSDGSAGIEAIPYTVLRDDLRKAERELRKKLESIDALASGETPSGNEPASEAPPPEAEGKPLLAPTQEWSNAEGRKIRAAVLAVEGATVKFLMEDGGSVDYPVEKLSPESRERLGKLAAAP